MSTRSMTVLESARGVSINLYRHCGGYPAEAGADFAATLRRKNGAADAATDLLTGKGGYELADWKPSDQGDLEFVYIAKEAPETPGSWSIRVYTRKGWGESRYQRWPVEAYTLAEFDAFIAREVAIRNQLAAEYAASLKAVAP